MAVENEVYLSKSTFNQLRKPLLIASSGGGGHISAAQGLIQNLSLFYKNIIFTQYDPVLLTEPSSPTQATMETAIGIMHAPYVGPLLQNIIKHTAYPTLPGKKTLKKKLIHSIKKKKNREHVTIRICYLMFTQRVMPA